jgi:regulator of protease activity HflC (stomatin/prohibitin superfamily)
MSVGEIIIYGILLVIILGIISFFISMIFKVDLRDLLPIIIVDSQKAIIIENRLGKDRVITEGFHFYVPIIEVPLQEVSLKEHQIDPPAQDVITKDNIKIEVDMIISVKITNPLKAVMEVEDYKSAVNSLLISSTLKKLGLMNFNSIQKEQDELAKSIKEDMKEDCKRWGVDVVLVKFESIAPPRSVKDALEKEIVAEKERKAAILKAEGEKRVRELQAESEKVLIEKKAEATVKAIKDLKDLMPNIPDEKIMQFLTSTAYIDSVKQLSTSDNSKFVLYPSDVNQPLDKIVTSEYLSKEPKKEQKKEL